MYVNVLNENYGYSVGTHDDWVVIGNPSSFRYTGSLPTVFTTGSVDIFKYNILTDQHDLLLTLNKPINAGDLFLLTADGTDLNIHTDIAKEYWLPSFYSRVPGTPITIRFTQENIPIQIDGQAFVQTREDDYGHSLDVYNDLLVVGSRWHNQFTQIGAKSFHATGSAVDVYNLSLLKSSPFDGFIATGSGFLANVISASASDTLTGSFGWSVSINDEWIAVGSPLWNTNKGGVHMFRRGAVNEVNNFTWNFYSTITGSALVEGDYFGYSVDLNKATGSYSGSIIVGCGNKTIAGSEVYYFEFNGSAWQEKYIFEADRAPRNLAFYDVKPVLKYENYEIDGYGNKVCLYKDNVAIGAPTDRWMYEYSGSSEYRQGVAYIYCKCQNTPATSWRLIKKFYGDENTLKNNKLGISMDIWDDKLVIGCPKFNAETITSCYEQGATFQSNYCVTNDENYIQGQWILLQKNTASVDTDMDWSVVNTYQKKKKYYSPYRAFGYDVAIANKSIVVGSPMLLTDSNRKMDIPNTGSDNNGLITYLEDLTGKAYIYNLNDLKSEFHVGNVFYRNGKIVLNTSGSMFDDLWLNPINDNTYQYELHFNSKQTLYEKQIVCTINPGEFNVSTNNTAIVYPQADFDINNNGKFDWQDMDMIMKYMQRLNTRYSATGPSTDWSSSILTEDDEISYYNYQSTLNSYTNSGTDFVSQSFYNILYSMNDTDFDFNQDSRVDLNDMNIFWKYYSNRLNQTNFKSYINQHSNRSAFNDIIDHLNDKTKRNVPPTIKTGFSTYASQSRADLTGSYQSVYITSLGLYDKDGNLVAVSKLGSPIKNTGDFPLNIVVKLDF